MNINYSFSNIGYDTSTSSYKIQQDGVYAIDNNVVISNVNNVTSNIVTASILVDGNPVISSEQSFGDTRTIQISELYYLKKNVVVTTRIGTSQVNVLDQTGVIGGFSVYFVKPLLDIAGEIKPYFYLFYYFIYLNIYLRDNQFYSCILRGSYFLQILNILNLLLQ